MERDRALRKKKGDSEKGYKKDLFNFAVQSVGRVRTVRIEGAAERRKDFDEKGYENTVRR